MSYFNPWRFPHADSWAEFALCREVGTEMFYPEEGAGRGGNTAEIRAVKSICHRCPVRRNCLDTALFYECTTAKYDRSGIWGGLTGRERHRVWKALKDRREVKLCKADRHPVQPGSHRCEGCHRESSRRLRAS